ncbi:GNAT family N-acetyltransferase [Streptomyces sp. 7-21]|jgi:GNAT superfamily N-acetyltransferase|uniref:GNAT family N-acetyltransferase n=1 Tax=Streptomyces sp. 7-21 TaxID=2802283 RepID=UPI00191ECCBB|nr:GNAT family N-acetyltransferase [Streptomyces sp. 7-21]MBL1068005.1 GNAT family N-acetyltransferase [Streptomyces sp. 7-21]
MADSGRVTVRPGRPGEAAKLSALALRSKGHWGYDEAFLAACADELTLREEDMTRRRVTVAERGGDVLGFATLEGDPPEGELGMLFVAPPAIGRGIGRQLFTHVVTAARAEGFTRLSLDADPHAEPFYRAMGAVRTGSSPSGSIPGRLLPRMTVTLTS